MKKQNKLATMALISVMTLSFLSGCSNNSSSLSQTSAAGSSAPSTTAQKTNRSSTNDFKPLVIAKQGTFTAGGTVTSTEGTYNPKDPFNPQGQTTHDGHASVFYQIPEGANNHPLVFLHGYGQSRVCWQTTADGREGFDTIFLRKGYGVYLVDQPGRGEADLIYIQTPIWSYFQVLNFTNILICKGDR